MSQTDLMAALESTGMRATLAKGETLFSSGQPCKNLYVILDGRVICRSAGKPDIEREAGDVLCLIDFLLGTPYSRSCEALSDVKLLIVPQENLVAMLEAADNVMAMMMKATAARIAAKQQGAPA